jgi:membrane protein DedA with SNARE-associated domain/rhodanese-related sulfurtransferase
MELSTHILLTYGYLLLFAWVLVEQLGLPLPAAPVLLAAGALSVDGPISFTLAFASGFAATLIADSVWFHVGRKYGHRVMHLLCRMALEPTSCVRRTQNSFGRREGVMLLFAKFVPGLATLAPPVAGQNGMDFALFLVYDGFGAVLWLGALLAGGRFFADVLRRDPRALDWVGRFSGALLILGIAGFFLARLWRHRRIVKKLAAARLEPEELKRQLDLGDEVYIVDLRHPLDLVSEPFTLPRARHFSPDALAARHQEIPRDRDIVLFCNCPSEASAAKTAMTLHRLGIERVRPLRGGYDEWKRLGYPLQTVQPEDSSANARRDAIS